MASAPGLDPVAVTLTQTSGAWQVLELGPSVDCESLPPDVTGLLGTYCT